MNKTLAIVDYEAGNLTSVFNAVSYLGFQAVVTKDPQVVRNADRVIFPGVGAAKSAMDQLNQSGLGSAVVHAVSQGKPVLGICIGCQIVLQASEEDGGVPCLALLPGQVVRFKNEAGIKIPHMGWNQVDYINPAKPHALFTGVPDHSEFYFVHSYYPAPKNVDHVASMTTYGTQRFASSLAHQNLFASQFHLEKSGDVGLQVLRNFCEWDGVC